MRFAFCRRNELGGQQQGKPDEISSRYYTHYCGLLRSAYRSMKRPLWRFLLSFGTYCACMLCIAYTILDANIRTGWSSYSCTNGPCISDESSVSSYLLRVRVATALLQLLFSHESIAMRCTKKSHGRKTDSHNHLSSIHRHVGGKLSCTPARCATLYRGSMSDGHRVIRLIGVPWERQKKPCTRL